MLPLHQIHRVNLKIDGAHVCSLCGGFREREVNHLTQARAAARFEQNLYAMFAAQAGEGRGRRA